MDDDELFRLYRAWRDAEQAYRDEVYEHMGWTSTGEINPPEPLTPAVLETIARLREASAAAQAAYSAAVLS